MVDTTASDLKLWQQMQQGSDLALGYLFDRYVDRLINYGKLITRDTELIEDCIQDVFVTLWTDRDRLSQAHSVRNYLYSSLRRALMLKAKQKQKEYSLHDHFDYATSVEDSYERWIVNQQEEKETKQAVAKLLETLTPQQKKVVFMKFYELYTYEEIAETLNLRVGTVYNIVSAALQRLKKTLEDTPSLAALFMEGGLIGLLPFLYQII